MAEACLSSAVAGLDREVRWVWGEGGAEKEGVVWSGEPTDSSEVWELGSPEGFNKHASLSYVPSRFGPRLLRKV